MKKGLSFFAALVAAAMILLLSATEPAFAREPKIAAPKAFKADFTYQVGSNPPEKGVMYFANRQSLYVIETFAALITKPDRESDV